MQRLRTSSSTSSSITHTSSCVMKPMLLLVMLIYAGFISDGKSAVGADDMYKVVPAVFFFGDSIVDPGNNNNRSAAVTKSNFLPYGKDFDGGRPTGRYCNGKIPPDFTAERLGLKELLPAFMDPSLTVQDLMTGVSFASGGSGYDPLTATLDFAIPMSEQIEMFKRYIAQLKTTIGPQKTSAILSKGIFVVSASSNDILQTYFLIRRRRMDAPTYAQSLTSLASSFVQGLHKLGVRRIGVLNAPPLGCVPSQRTLGGGIFRDCSEPQNQASLVYNAKLSSEMAALRTRLPDSKIVVLDVYTPLLEIIQNPDQYGFEEVGRGCCGTGLIEVTVLCNKIAPICEDASKYVFWDSFHPTEATYKILVQKILNNKTLHEFL